MISYDTFLKNSEYFKLGKQNRRDYLPLKTSAEELQVSDLIGDELLTIESEDDLESCQDNDHVQDKWYSSG